MTDLVERIETTRFLGVEFLIWLWFKSELFEGNTNTRDGEPLEVWLDAQLLLQSTADAGERTLLRGIAPSASKEAKLALSSGKQPVRARVCLSSAGRDFAFVFDAPAFAMGSVTLPVVLTEDDDEAFIERMALLEQLHALWMSLYAEFLELRVSELWQSEFEPELAAWIQGRSSMTPRAYAGLQKRAAKA